MSENVAPKKKFGEKVTDFFKGVKGEFKKIVWPTKKTVLNNTGVVIAFIIVVGILVYLLDLLFGTAFRTFIKL